MKTVSLLLFVLLGSTTILTDVSLATCGCNATSRVYIQYKSLVTGWFQLMADKPCFQREFPIEINLRTIQYFLCYKRKWTLWEYAANTYKRILKFRGNTNKLKIICPQTDCGLSIVEVDEHPILSGRYFPVYKDNILYTEFDIQKLNFTDTLDYFINITVPLKKPSPEMLPTDLSSCLQNHDTNSKENNNTFKRTQSVVYVRKDGAYNFTQAPEGDFWWINSHDMAYAISNQGAACAYDLSKETEWIAISETGELYTSNMKVKFVKHE
ncbi:uncharacterized protein [Palaemon carinicauda]|uniref:uncharacterized protein n=1 Tax=Palaemon carinicauda TaxID=392227 RepID=UPI0035B634AF